MTNPFDGHALPSPGWPDEVAARIARDRYGLTGELRPLGSHQDQNWLVDGPRGRFVLKVSNPGFTHSGLHAQNAAMLHLATSAFPYRVPVPVADRDGALVGTWTHGEQSLDVRLVTFVDGEPLACFAHLAPSVVYEHGALAAHAANALAGFAHPGLDRVLQWDLRHAFDVVDALVQHVGDPTLAATVRQQTEAAAHALAPLRRRLRTAVVHADVTDVNVVAVRDGSGRPHLAGLIDFGDIANTWLVADPAVAACSLLAHDLAHPLELTCDVLRGFDSVLALTDDDVEAMWPLVVARAASCVVSSEQQAALEPDNAYALESCRIDRQVMAAVSVVPIPLAHAMLRHALGRTTPPIRTSLPVSPMLDEAGELLLVDLSSTSLQVDLGSTPPTVDLPVAYRTRYGEARLDRTSVDQTEQPSTIALGIEAHMGRPTSVRAPFAATVSCLDPLQLRVDDTVLVVDGVEATIEDGLPVEPGTVLGTATTVYVQWRPESVSAPKFCEPSLAGAWRSLCPDPSAVLGVTRRDEDQRTSSELVAARRHVLAAVQEHYYRAPPRIERGWRHHVFDTSARGYLDMVNNVASIGHAHPVVTEAVHRQLRLLNTNSRFNYGVGVEFAERLVELLPEPLDTVFLVNTGSEAVDLALRIAGSATGGSEVLAVRGSYHGWTAATDAISTSLADNPTAVGTRPPNVHVVESPNRYRGRHRGPDAGDRYADDVRRAVREATGSGRGVAAFVAEPLYGNAGGVELPPGYLAQAYDAVRAAGGVCVADEVQVGYGRTGDHFWAFDGQDVVPDIVCVAKAAGNGMALGAVITARHMAEAFTAAGSFFSSVGGSPVSCAAGLAVLDVIRDEGLQTNAATVGGHLKTALQDLAGRHRLVGAVHGRGLYLGVELVRDRDTLEPATREADAICERMLRLGVVVQPTGDHLNVLKVKPPLCLTTTSADFFVATLDQVLTDGW